jgi:hypothetical protein
MIVRIVLLVIIIFLSVTIAQKVVLALVKRKMARLVKQRFAGRQIIMMSPYANFFGAKSKGMGQIRGNGALVLTADQLWFCLAAPTREITIPIDRIRAVESKRSHLGKSIFRPLLAVTYDDKENTDQIAWYVTDLKEWETAIINLIER